jgi:hypothetical protein
MKNIDIKKLVPYLAAVVIFIIISLAYLNPLLEGKKLRQDDITRHKGMSKEITDFREKTGEEPLWTSSMFGGMPAYQISVDYKANLIKYIDKVFKLGLPHPAGLVFLYMLGFFILLISLRMNPWLSVAGAIAFGLSSYFFIILGAGHNSKAHAIGYMAPVVAGFIMTYRGKYIQGGILTMLFLALEIQAGHPQITYYLFLLLLFFGFSELIYSIKEKAVPSFARSTLIVFIAAFLAVLTNITSLWATYEYGKYTIRGKTELTTEQENRTSGLDKDYATQWSYGKGETWSLMVPNAKGGASGALAQNETAMDKIDPSLRSAVAQNRVSQYWGDQPFTSGPVYAGAFIMFLFIYGLFIVKGRMKWWLLAGTLLSIMLAWGKNFMPLTEFFLDYFPGYNKFRAVSMTLVIAELTIPLLGLLALNNILKEPGIFKKKINIYNFKINPFYLSFGLTAGLSLIFALVPDWFFSFLSDYENQMIANQNSSNPESASQIAEFFGNVEIARMAIFKADALRSFIIILIGGAILWGFALGKIKRGLTFGLLIVLILVDMWGVDKRYLNDDNFVGKSKVDKPYTMSAADKLILKDKDPNFRVLNLTVDPFADASTSYFHKSIGGYHGAKLRRYQELYDHQIKEKFNRDVLNMLNTKYFIQADESRKPVVVPNPQALGNAWFVEEVKMVKNADEELEVLSNFDPEKTAVIDERFKDELSGFSPKKDSSAQIKLIDYKPNDLRYQVNSQKDQLAVFSEIYYPKGWNAYVDGEPTLHFRADFVLRAMIIPAGKHLVEFKFEPKVYSIGEKVSFGSSLLVILLLIGFVVYEIKKLKEETVSQT